MKKTKEYKWTEADIIQAFNCCVSGLHGCTARYTRGSKAAMLMWLHAIKKTNLENSCQKMNQSQQKPIENGQS